MIEQKFLFHQSLFPNLGGLSVHDGVLILELFALDLIINAFASLGIPLYHVRGEATRCKFMHMISITSIISEMLIISGR